MQKQSGDLKANKIKYGQMLFLLEEGSGLL